MADHGMTADDERDFIAHKREFDRICDQYKLRSEEKAGAIADFLTTPRDDGTFSAEDFAKEFEIEPVDAIIFLSWINVGIKYKELHLNDKDKKTLAELGLGN